MTMRLLSTWLLTLLTLASLAAVDTPTREQWAPVQAVLTKDQPEAESLLSAIVARYPRWADGYRELARLRLKHADSAAAEISARQALTLAPNDGDAQTLLVQALLAGGKREPAYAAADAPGDPRSPWAHYYAGDAALDAGEREHAEHHIGEARRRSGNRPPPEILLLSARLALWRSDYAAALEALTLATANKPDFYVGWYELGRVRVLLARQDPAHRAALLTDAEGNFITVVAARPDDDRPWLGLGQARLELGRDELVRGQRDAAVSWLTRAIEALGNAVARNPDNADAQLALGTAQLQLDRYADAAEHLARAQALGAHSRELLFNLALALQNSGHADAAGRILSQTEAVSLDEKLTSGVNAFQRGDLLLAVQLLSAALPALTTDHERTGATQRFIGHAYRALAARQTTPEATDAYRDLARDAYRNAGELRDSLAREHYLALESSRDANRAMAAASVYQGWQRWLSLSGWRVVLGNYGAWASGGDGVGGLWQRHPGHACAWGAVLALLVIGLIRSGVRRRPAGMAVRSATRRSTRDPRQPDPSRAIRHQRPDATGALDQRE